MPLKWFECPDKTKILAQDCLKEGGCRMGQRCATRSYLQLVGQERPWTGKPSTTQLIQGTMCAFLKLTKDYSVSPDARAFMINGTKAHANLEAAGDECSMLEEKFNSEEDKETGISDVIETELEKTILADYKTSGSFKIAKALGFHTVTVETGELFKTGKRAGQPKTRQELRRDDSKIDRRDWELQLNNYRIKAERKFGIKINELRIQCIARDGGTYVARQRGVFRNVYYFTIKLIPDEEINTYFDRKRKALFQALKQGYWKEPCTGEENWDGVKCARYCEVADYCSYGRYLKAERETEDMAIKGISEIRRFPRMGKIRLGIKRVAKSGKEYPAEVDYFILDPETAVQEEREKILSIFHQLYGDQPKSIRIMFPMGDLNTVFPQFYKRYGKTTSLQCKGDGEIAFCASDEFAQGLERLKYEANEIPAGVKVRCKGKDCPHYQNRQCTESATLQVLLPELPGSGVWQVTTGSFNSIVNINSCLEYVRNVAGRFHMIPLTLERRPQDVQHKDEKTGEISAREHYILHIGMDLPLAALQKYAMVDCTRIAAELPAPAPDENELLLELTPEEKTTSEAVPVEAKSAEKPAQAAEVQKQPQEAAPTAQKTTQDNAGLNDAEFYGNMERFNGSRPGAEKTIALIKEYRKKLGDSKFFRVLGEESLEKVAEIKDLQGLTHLANSLKREIR